MPRRKPSKYPLGLWHEVELLITRRDLVLLGAADIVWFSDRTDSITPELGQLLREWKVELIRFMQKDASAKARASKGGA
jgi:hypothetical protein